MAEFTERERLILTKIESGEQQFYETVRKEFSSNDIQVCPYCFQDITKIKEEIVESINKILNKDVDMHKEELEELKVKFTTLDELENDSEAIDEKSVLEANNIIAKINEQINNYIIPKIDEKLNNIYMPITGFSSNITELESSLNKTLENIENKRKEFNKAVDEKENNRIQLDNLNLKISWYEIKDNYQSFQLQEKEYKKY